MLSTNVNLTALTSQLCNAILQLKNVTELQAFLNDLCTPAERKSLGERLKVAHLLMAGFLSYREIHDLTKVSIATITRVARFLLHENNNGYKTVLKRLTESGLLPKPQTDSEYGIETLIVQLCNALLSLKTEHELLMLLKDLCTPAELKAFSERLEVARLLSDGFLSYREIHEITRVSIATITRVARFLLHENNHGYKMVLKRLSDTTQNGNSSNNEDNVTSMSA